MAVSKVVVRKSGVVEFIHTDGLVDLLQDSGKLSIRRASHVEPGPDGWTADLRPLGGPVLGPYPHHQRDQALADEVAWIEANYLGVS